MPETSNQACFDPRFQSHASKLLYPPPSDPILLFFQHLNSFRSSARAAPSAKAQLHSTEAKQREEQTFLSHSRKAHYRTKPLCNANSVSCEPHEQPQHYPLQPQTPSSALQTMRLQQISTSPQHISKGSVEDHLTELTVSK